MTGKMSGLDARGIHYGQSVLDHLRDRDSRSGRLALSYPAIVESDAAEGVAQTLCLR
jgi:hypothetical protein